MMENQIVKIICGKENGTAFYVSEKILITAHHVVDSYVTSNKNVIIDEKLGELTFDVVTTLQEYDVALIKVEKVDYSEMLPLYPHKLREGEQYETFGFPDTASKHGALFEGQVKERIANSTSDFKLLTADADEYTNYEGMSGAPVVQNKKIVGVVIEQSGKDLNIISISNMESSLRKVGLSIETEISLSSIPSSIQEDVKSSVPNYDVFEKLDDRVTNICQDWLLLYGTPGSGKTTISAGYVPRDNTVKVLGRFFFKVPNDVKSRAERCSKEFFVDWLESIYITETGDNFKKLTLSEKRGRIPEWLTVLNRVLVGDNKTGLIIIDGLDELVDGNDNRVSDILSLFPEKLPDNIKIILSCICEEIIPSSIIENISDDDKIQVSPLQMAPCEAYIKKNSGDWEKPYSVIQSLANKVEGHPLYMNYLCRYISQNFNSTTKENELNTWIESLPSIGGDIKSYYNAVWKKIDGNPQVYEVLAVLSQTRGSVNEEQLLGMLSSHNVYAFIANIKEYRHLLKEQGSDKYEIYHSSFRLYISQLLKMAIKQTNDQIALYCEAHDEELYAIENYLHHVLNGSDFIKGLHMCNQEWADKCAIHNVSPDLILHDIKENLSFAVDKGMAIEVVRLMLLAQRIEFRCDSIMVNNAEELAEINIAMGKPDVALKYIIRDEVLLVAPVNATKYLRLMFDLGYYDNALQLAEKMDSQIRKEVESLDGKGISTVTFVQTGIIHVERYISGIDDATQLNNFYGLLMKMKDGCDENSLIGLQSVIDYVIVYQMARTIQSGKKVDINKHLEMLKMYWSEPVIVMYMKALAFINSFDTSLRRIVKNEAYYDCLHQIEMALANFDFHFDMDDYPYLLHTLMCDSRRSDLFSHLLSDYKYKYESLNLLKPNRVDIDYESLVTFYQENEYKGYVDDQDSNIPIISNDYEGWDKYLESLVKRLAYVQGRLYYRKAIGRPVEDLYILVTGVLKKINFSFDNRTQWNRSYLIPEELFPYIYAKCMEIYRDFFPDKIDDIIHHILSRKDSQLCLYKEGYTQALINMAEVLVGFKPFYDAAILLIDIAVNYVLYAIQNKSEKCNYLLTLCKLLSVIGERTRSEQVYMEILKSSMGPDWYKEAQLDLMNYFESFDIKLTGEQAARFSAIFEEASGEMTFQRYVQQEKNHYVGTLARASSVRDAINYYKFETLPDADTVINNAEDWKVDMPKLGNGYDLGANHLIESSAICYLLLSCDNASPYIRYAISELFWDNWDKMHNDHNFAKLHSHILMNASEEDVIENLIPRMSEYYVNNYNHDKVGEYLNDIEKVGVSDKILNEFKNNLEKRGYEWKRRVIENKGVREEKLRDKLDRYPSSKEILNEMRRCIISPIGDYWHSLSEFLVPLVTKKDFDKENLFNVIAKHYEINIQPSSKQFDKFTWFMGAHNEDDIDKQLVHFLIWFLIHPDYNIDNRTQDSLLWLYHYEPIMVLESLVEEILAPSDYGLDTKASEILLNITKDSSEKVLEFICNAYYQKLAAVEKFSVSRNLYEMGLVISQNEGDDTLLSLMKPIIPDNIADRGDIFIEHKDALFIMDKIDKINDLQLTGGKAFAEPYLDEWRKLFNSGLVEKMIKSDKYIRRSFSLNYSSRIRYDRMMSDVLDGILYRKVDYKRAGRVYYAINN